MVDPYLTGGERSGQKLVTPSKENDDIRPMRSRIRESLFHAIGDEVEGETALDLFAGTGALGLECLSRGAQCSVFVDSSGAAIDCIRRNLRKTGYSESATIERANAFQLSGRSVEKGEPFDRIFITPPYDLFRSPDSRRKLLSLLTLLGDENWLGSEGTLVVESPSGEGLGEMPFSVEDRTRKRYGITELLIVTPGEERLS